MIKKLIFIIMFFIPISLYAEVWDSELIIDESKYVEESEVRYKFYKEEFLYSVYEEVDLNYLSSYDFNDFIYTDYSSWDDEYPLYKYGRVVEETKGTLSFDTDKFNYIVFNDFKFRGILKLTGVFVQDSEGSNIDFEIIFNNESDEFKNLIPNTMYETGVNLNKDLIIKLKFNDYLSTKDVSINFYFKSLDMLSKSFNFSFVNDEKYSTKNKTFSTSLYNNNYDEESKKIVINDTNDYNVVTNFIVKLYRYKDVLFKRNVYEKVYLDDYYKEIDGFVKDITTAKVFYKYKDKENNDKKLCLFEDNKEDTLVYEDEIIEKNNDNLAISNKVALNTNNNDDINFYLIYGSVFIILGIILLGLFITLKKIIEKCRMK